MKRIALVFFILLNSSFSSAQKMQLPAFITDSLNSYITQGMHNWEIPGLSIAIVKDVPS